MTKPRQYGKVWGVPELTPEDPQKCVSEVRGRHRSDLGYSRQCSRKRGHGPDGLHCRAHAKLEQEKADRAAGIRQTVPGSKSRKPPDETVTTERLTTFGFRNPRSGPWRICDDRHGTMVSVSLAGGITVVSVSDHDGDTVKLIGLQNCKWSELVRLCEILHIEPGEDND